MAGTRVDFDLRAKYVWVLGEASATTTWAGPRVDVPFPSAAASAPHGSPLHILPDPQFHAELDDALNKWFRTNPPCGTTT
jgi:hypothetical protein